MANDPWAATNQGLSNLGNTMMSLAQLKRQDDQQARQNRLVDLQTQEMERGITDRNAARAALANQPDRTARLTTLADLASQGNMAAMEMYGPAESLNQKLIEHKAQAEAYGDAEGAAKAAAVLQKMDLSGKALQQWMKIDPSGNLARQQMAANPGLFNGMDPAQLQVGDGQSTPPAFFPTPDGGFTFHDGKEWKHVKKDDGAESWGSPEELRVGGKTAIVQKSNRGQIRPVIQDTAPRITVNGGHGGAGGDVGSAEAWAKAIRDGRANLSDIPARGTIRTDVIRILERDGGVDYAAKTADNKAFAASIAQQQKQLGSMGSFVKNLDLQVDKVKKLSKDLSTFDTRLLNIPLRAIRGRIAGSPQQAKYDMYLAEIESEIGKLATGSTGSVAELSASAQERWAKIHDKNLSVKDMLQLLEETREAGKLRMKSVEDQLKETRAQMRNRGGGNPNEDAGSFVRQQYAEYRKAGLNEDQIRQRVSSKLRKAGWKDNQIAAALRENSGNNGAIVTKGGFKVTKVE